MRYYRRCKAKKLKQVTEPGANYYQENSVYRKAKVRWMNIAMQEHEDDGRPPNTNHGLYACPEQYFLAYTRTE